MNTFQNSYYKLNCYNSIFLVSCSEENIGIDFEKSKFSAAKNKLYAEIVFLEYDRKIFF